MDQHNSSEKGQDRRIQVDLERKPSLEGRIAQSIKADDRDKLIPYVQMHEFEGLMFSSPHTIATVLQDEQLEPWAEGVLGEFDNNPEKINKSPETAPSKRPIRQSRYRKTTHGPAIAARIGLEGLRERCAGFDGWIASLEALGQMLD